MQAVERANDGLSELQFAAGAASTLGGQVECRSFRDWFEQSGSSDVYFILGVQGSGTNLTARVLQSVFDFSAVLDGSLIFDAAVRVERRPRRDVIVREFERVRRRFFPGQLRRRVAIRHHHHRNAGFVDIEREFDPSLVTDGASFARFFYAYHAWTLGRRRMLVKSDDLWQHIESLGRLFPRRKCVLLVRDPRDNALSISRKDFGPCDIYLAACLTNHQMELYRQEAARRPDDAITVQYETLLDKPMTFVDEFSARFGFSVPGDAADRIDRLGIRSDNSQKWRGIPASDIAACEWVLERHLLDFGYELSGQSLTPPSLAGRVAHRVGDLIHRIPQKFERFRHSLTEAPAGGKSR